MTSHAFHNDISSVKIKMSDTILYGCFLDFIFIMKIVHYYLKFTLELFVKVEKI